MTVRAALAVLLCLAAFGPGCRHPSAPAGSSTSTALTDSRWLLTHVGGTRVIDVAPEARPYLRFVSAEERVEGYGSCNGFSAPYRMSGTALRLAGPATATERACADPALNDQEQRFLSALGSMVRYSLDGDVLTLYSDRGVIARLERGN